MKRWVKYNNDGDYFDFDTDALKDDETPRDGAVQANLPDELIKRYNKAREQYSIVMNAIFELLDKQGIPY